MAGIKPKTTKGQTESTSKTRIKMILLATIIISSLLLPSTAHTAYAQSANNTRICSDNSTLTTITGLTVQIGNSTPTTINTYSTEYCENGCSTSAFTGLGGCNPNPITGLLIVLAIVIIMSLGYIAWRRRGG